MGTSDAVQELMEEFWLTEQQAIEIAELEEMGFVCDETGAILPDVDPDQPIDLAPPTGQGEVRWN